MTGDRPVDGALGTVQHGARLGVLDIGSNTVHLLIVDMRLGGRPVPTRSHKQTLRLMRYLQDDGSISDEGVAALLSAIGECVDIARAEALDDFVVMATSALREAANGEEVVARIEREAEVSLDILSGPDEARLTFLAVRRWFGWAAGRILLLDIGGGSLEIAVGDDEEPAIALSVPLGAGRSTVGFFHDDPPSAADQRALRAYAKDVLEDAVAKVAPFGRPDHVIGSSKTIRSLARLAGNALPGVGDGDRAVLSRAQLDDWVPRLARMDATSRTALPGITTDRTFQIVAGGIVLSEAVRAFRVAELDVSPWALREGRLLQMLDRV
ncbi:Ppx/GppA phosphatase family protein [Agrococcus sp. HG114]|uniref:Ppx/GppA phosphatase family protein n=1 Tax=Agrococcus sp. HG114 TaxID=2969757 RepID=UPI00215B2FB8|nr:Ppx/GppA phosphatase family protein [Agrococcus sp. HG114]MCR8669669.1 Ppx/GppA family phosphatase [Agrococcus sp. HG114]